MEGTEDVYRAVFQLWGNPQLKTELRELPSERLNHFYKQFGIFLVDSYRNLLAKRGLRGAELYVEEGSWISSSQALSFASREAVRDTAPGATCPLTEALVPSVGRRLLDQGLLAKLKSHYIPRFGVKAQGSAIFEQTDQLAIPWSSGEAGVEAFGVASARRRPCALTKPGKHLDVANAYRVNYSEFGLFAPEEEACLEGTLISEPRVSAHGNVMALIRDTSGEIGRILLYDQLPPGAERGPQTEVLARAAFPRGTRLTVLEPLPAVPRDGIRGMYVSAPSEVRKFIGGADALDLAEAKAAGNAAVGRGQHAAAVEFYRLGLNHADTEALATLLSNRAQAELKLEQYAGALADTAAALQLRPADGKAWARYALALGGLGCDSLAVRAEVVASGGTSAPADSGDTCDLRRATRSAALSAAKTAATVVGPGEKPLGSEPIVGDAAALKALANDEYKLGKFGTARGGYTKALACEKKTADAAAALGNLAHCCLLLGELHNALAAAAACLRLCPASKVAPKAVHRLALALALLGEPGTAAEVLAAVPLPDGIGDVAKQCATLAEQVEALRAREERGYSAADLVSDAALGAVAATSEAGAPVAAEWLGPLAIESLGGAILANRDLSAGEVVLVQRPLKGLAHGVHGQTTAAAVDDCLRTSSEWLCRRLAHASGADLAAAQAIGLLGQARHPDLISSRLPPPSDLFAALLQRLSPRLLPMLGQRPDFAPAIERLPAPWQLVEVLIAEHQARPTLKWQMLLAEARSGSTAGSPTSMNRSFLDKATGFYPAIALLGQVGSHLANCALAPVAPRAAGALAVFTTKAVPSGHELLLAESE